MASNDNVIRLLVAEEVQNDAEQLINVLRNHGIAVRPTWVNDDDELQAALGDGPQDLMLCAPALADLPLDMALRVLERSGKDLPLIVLTDSEDSALRIEVMALGAVDQVSKNDADHFRLVVLREFRNLQGRRQLRRSSAQLRETERRCHALLDSSRDAIAYVHEGMHVYANTSYLERFGMATFDELEGLPLLDLVAGNDQGQLKDFLRRYSKGSQDRDEIGVRIPGGEETVRLEFSPASWDGEACTQILIRDESSSAELEAQIAALSRQDVLTGLYNRRYFIEQLDQCIAEALESEGGKQNALIYLQPDNVDAIQNSVGISAVDQVLADMALILREHLGDRHVAGRYSDTVLTVLLRDCGVHEALAIAEAVRAGVEAHVTDHDGRTVTKTCSLGVAVLGDTVSQAGQAINLGYTACEVAREDGGDRVHLYTAAEEEQGSSTNWKNRLEDALQGEGFQLLFQPLVALAGDQSERYEVRLRLQEEDGRAIPPAEFLPQAEALGLSARIDRWVIDEAVRRIGHRRGQGGDTTVFVKIGAASLTSDGLAAVIGEALRTHGVPGENLVVQIAEPAAVTQLNDAKELFRQLKELQCGVALDEFGAGLNPFQLVRHLPADYLKLDRELTSELGTGNDEVQERVRELIQSAHEMRKKVVAGYLAEATVLATLWQYQVDLVQGAFLGEPQPEMNYDFSGMVI